MKTLVIGLDGASPEPLLDDDGLATIRSLMEVGCYGRLESVAPPASVPGWICLATGQNPGALGIYGATRRVDRSYKALEPVDSSAFQAPTLWDQAARDGGKAIVIGVPPAERPAAIADDKAELYRRILEESRSRFQDARRRLENEPWDYFQIVETGLDRVQRAFWRWRDPEHALHEPDGPFQNAVRDYHRHLDEELAGLLDLLTEETVVLVVSTHGAQRLDGGFCVNEWLIREGLLKLRSHPDRVEPFERLDVDWARTKAWAEGGSHAQIFLNVKGREPEGTIEPADYERFRDDLKARLEAEAEGAPLGTLAYRPEEVYREVRGVAPDLIVHFGGLRWTAIGGVGHRAFHVRGEGAGLDGSSPARLGAFVLASPQLPPMGEIQGAGLLDIAPTLLDLTGRDRLPNLLGRSLVEGRDIQPPGGEATPDDEELIRERLRGLGYIG